jgi:hypothetical protein
MNRILKEEEEADYGICSQFFCMSLEVSSHTLYSGEAIMPLLKTRFGLELFLVQPPKPKPPPEPAARNERTKRMLSRQRDSQSRLFNFLLLSQ